MAKTIEQLKTQSAEVMNASVIGENTATRVGSLFNDIVEHVESYEAGQAQKDTEQSTSINEETNRATAAETTLSERIDQEVTERKAMDETIGVQLSNEIARAKEMELGISTKLNDEIERAQEAENNLQEKITSEAEARDLAINAEAQARTQNDQLLSRAIVAEQERAETSEQHLQESVDSVKKETLEENRNMVNSILENYAPIEITGNVNNAADEEDLTSVNIEGTDVLKFKDKVYNPLTYSGLGRKYLRKNIVNGVNILTQSMINQANTIYVIQYDYVLGEDITVPNNCILDFDGGSVSAGSGTNMNTIIGNNTIINAGPTKIFSLNLITNGYFIGEGNVLWWGVKLSKWNFYPSSSDNIDTTQELQAALDSGFDKLYFPSGKYYITNTLTLSKPKYLKLEKGIGDNRISNINSTASIIYTNNNITLLNIAPIITGKSKFGIEGGVFDVREVENSLYTPGTNYSKSVIKVGQQNGLLWGSYIDTDILGFSYNTNSCGISFCENSNLENDMFTLKGNISGLFYGIRIFNQGVCSNLCWLGDISCFVGVSIENTKAGYARLFGTFQAPGAFFNVVPSEYKTTYSAIYINTNDVLIDCVLNDSAGNGTYAYAINIGDNARNIYVSASNQWLLNNGYIKGNLDAIISSNFDKLEVFNNSQFKGKLFMGNEIKVPDMVYEYDGEHIYFEIKKTVIVIEEEGDYKLNLGELVNCDIITLQFRELNENGGLSHSGIFYANASVGQYKNLVHFTPGKYGFQFSFPSNPVAQESYGFRNATLSKAERYGEYSQYFRYLSDIRDRIPNKIMVGTFKQALYNPKEGEFFYCKDKGKPIWWNGSAWVDATGTPV